MTALRGIVIRLRWLVILGESTKHNHASRTIPVPGVIRIVSMPRITSLHRMSPRGIRKPFGASPCHRPTRRSPSAPPCRPACRCCRSGPDGAVGLKSGLAARSVVKAKRMPHRSGDGGGGRRTGLARAIGIAQSVRSVAGPIGKIMIGQTRFGSRLPLATAARAADDRAHGCRSLRGFPVRQFARAPCKAAGSWPFPDPGNSSSKISATIASRSTGGREKLSRNFSWAAAGVS